MKNMWHELTMYDGRIGRLKYLGYHVLNWVAVVVALLVCTSIFQAVAAVAPAVQVIGAVTAVGIGIAAVIAYVYISVCVTVRRLHDMDLSGWHYLWLVGASAAGSALQTAYPEIGLLFSIAVLVGYGVLCCVPGTTHANKYDTDLDTHHEDTRNL